jgi:chromate transporter
MDDAQPIRTVSALDVFLAFLGQGLTAFGGPVAHLGYFRREFVERRGWLTEAAYADLLALCNFLPGRRRARWAWRSDCGRRAGRALAAFAGFTAPAARR